MTEEQKQELKELLYNKHRISNMVTDDPLVSIWFSDLVDLIEEYSNKL